MHQSEWKNEDFNKCIGTHIAISKTIGSYTILYFSQCFDWKHGNIKISEGNIHRSHFNIRYENNWNFSNFSL